MNTPSNKNEKEEVALALTWPQCDMLNIIELKQSLNYLFEAD